MMTQTRRLSIPYCLVLTATALSLSGCIGVFEHQPPRYNYVAGGKRSPMLNPGGANYQPPKGEEGVSQESFGTQGQSAMIESTPPIAGQQASASPLAAGAAQMGSTVAAGAEPSPLYYYEQQNAQVTAADLPAPNAPSVDAQMVAANAVNSVVNAPEAKDAKKIKASGMKKNTEEYPQLQSVKKSSPELQKTFDDAKTRAKEFEAANRVDPTLGEAQYQPTTPMLPNVPISNELMSDVPMPSVPMIDVTKQPIQPISMDTPPPVAILPLESEKENTKVSAFIPVTPIVTPAASRDIVTLPKTVASEATIADMSLEKAMEAPTPASVPVTTDVTTRQPIALPPMQASSLTMQPLSVAPVPVEPIINALAPTPIAPPVAATQMVYSPEENIMAVPSASPVAAVSQIQRSEPIRLIAPPSMRGREIPQSRYSNMRRNPTLRARPSQY